MSTGADRPAADAAGGRITGMHDDDRTGDVAADPSPWIGRVIDDRYEILDLLGEGGMGAVFLAEHLKLRKQVALKTIHADLAGVGDIATRFAREATASARLEHPHVASASDYGALPEGGAYLVMQLVRGNDLGVELEQYGRMAWPRAAVIGAQIADALAAAHASGIVHRDLKPDNVVLEQREDGSELVKVLDFGIARVIADESAAPAEARVGKTLTRVGTIMGTPGYMAPEQATGDSLDHRVDLYALGVILWELVTGIELYPESDLTQIVRRQLTEAPQLVSAASQDSTVPPGLDALIARLLAPMADDRPHDAGEVRDALLELAQTNVPSGSVSLTTLAGRPSSGAFQVRATAPTEHAARAVQARTSLERVAAAVPPRARLPLLLAVAGGATVFLALAATVVYVALSDDEPATVAAPDAPAAAPRPPQPGPGPAPGPGPGAEPPPLGEVDQHLLALTEGLPRERRDAAQWLRDRGGQRGAAPWVIAVADLELARGCRAKKTALERVGEIGDPRALPMVVRLDRHPRSGCGGLLKLRDCYACLRDDVTRVRRELEAAAGAVPP